MASVEWINPAAPRINQAGIEAVSDVLRSGAFAQGPKVAQFEEEFARYLGTTYECVAVNSGTSALHLGLMAAGVGPGDEVICPSFSFAASGNAIALTGATPVFCDIDLDTFCVDVAHAESLISERTVGIMAVHLYGQSANIDQLKELTRRKGLQLYEDAAQAHGATWDSTKVGSFGTFGAFSFYPTKNMTSGEGGMVVLESSEHARKVRLLRNQGMLKQYENEVVGFNLRMTDIHAAIGLSQLSQLDSFNKARQSVATRYSDGLKGCKLPFVHDKSNHVYHQFTVLVGAERDSIVNHLRDEHRVRAGVYYKTPIHKLPPFLDCSQELPNVDKASSQCLSLPIHAWLSDEDVDRVIECFNETIQKVGGEHA